MSSFYAGAVNSTQINLDVAQVELTTLVVTSTSISPTTFYCNSPDDTFLQILNQVTLPDTQIILSSGTFVENIPVDLSGNTGLAIIGSSTYPPLSALAFDLITSAHGCRLTGLVLLNPVSIQSDMSTVLRCAFNDSLTVENANANINIDSCEFSTLGSITVAATFEASGGDPAPILTFSNCNFGRTTINLNQLLPEQVVFRNCFGFASTPTNCTYIGINTFELSVGVFTTTSTANTNKVQDIVGQGYVAVSATGGNDAAIDLYTNSEFLNDVPSSELYMNFEGITFSMRSPPDRINNPPTITMDMNGSLIFYSGILTDNVQNIENLKGTTTSKALVLTSGSGGAVTFQDGTTQSTAAVAGGQVDSVVSGTYISVDSTDPMAPVVNLDLPTNTVKNNLLISSETGVLSWTPGPISSGTYYVNDGVNDLSSVLNQIGLQQGAQIIVSSGSFGGDPISVTQDNLAIIGPNCTPAIVELIRAVTVSGTRIRMTHIQFDGIATLTGNSCIYSFCDFPDNVTVGSGVNTGYITLVNCEFASGKTITINATGNSSAIYFINCNIGGATVVVNSASPLQVIFNNCAGFLALPLSTKATLVGVNVLASGVINNVIQRTILAAGRGTAGQVMVSGGASGNDTWSAVPSDATKYDVAGGNITGDVTLSATKSITADILNIKTLNIGSPQYITASTGVINSTVSVTRLSPGLNLTQAVTIANGISDGFVKVIEIIDSVATSIVITGANLHSTLSFTTNVGVGGQGAILVWDNDSEFWIVTALNNGAGGGSGGQVNSVVAGTYIGVDATDPVNPNITLDLPACDTDGKVLSSLTDGTLSWVAGGGGGSFMPINDGAGTGNTTLEHLQITATSNVGVACLKVVGSVDAIVLLEIGAGDAGNTVQMVNHQVVIGENKPVICQYGFAKAINNILVRDAYTICGNRSPVVFYGRSSQSGTPYAVANNSFVGWNPVIFDTQKDIYQASLSATILDNGVTISVGSSSYLKITWSSTVFHGGVNKSKLVIDDTGEISYGTTCNESNKAINTTSIGTWIGLVNYNTKIRVEHYSSNEQTNGMGGDDYISGAYNTNATITIEDIGGEYLAY